MSPPRTHPPEPAPLRPFDFPPVQRGELDNGLQILSARDGDMPLVTLALVVEAGGAADPAAQAGVASLTASALTSGMGGRDADEVAWAIEKLGVHLSARAGWDAAFVRVTVPAGRLDAAARLFADVVRRPDFPADEVERLRDQQLARLLQRRKQPGALASDAAARFIFAPETPWARPLIGTTPTVQGLTRDRVVAFYETRFMPNSATLIAVGDIDSDRAHELAREGFGDWSPGEPTATSFDVEPALERSRVFVVDRPGSVQSEIRIGDVGVERRHADYFPLLIMNAVLGGSFTSRLNMSLREKHGFTYGVRSGFAFRRRPGPFVVQTAVANDVTGRAVEESMREIRRLRDEGADGDEVARARDYLSGLLPLQLQTTSQLAARLDDLVVYDLPDDYFQHYREHIAAVTPDDVQRVARAHLRPDRLAVVVVGAAADIVPQLEALGIGDVEVVDA